MIEVIYKKEKINVWDLIDEDKVSIRDYYNLKCYMEHKYKSVKFDKHSKSWILLADKKEVEELV